MILEEYETHLQARAFSPRTIRSYRETLRRYSKYLHPTPILEADHLQLRAWIAGMGDTTPKTRASYIDRVSAFYAWAVRETLIDSNPADRVYRPKLSPRKPRPISEEDLEKALANAPDARMYLWLVLAAKAGLRCIEIANLRADWILDGAEPTLRIIGKGDKEREVPLHPDVMEALTAYGIPPKGPLFPTTWSSSPTMPPSTVSKFIAEYLHDLGIHATAHQLRHRFATRLYQSTRDLLLTQRMLGHSSPTTTAIYADIGKDAVRSVLDAV